ncbi:cupin domain-containing protein [Aquabacterium sp.]|uniref:cupin domain-containing protein n=1 Tax=Aquabacterium sp. TaxID=1872578 RepID=UPI003784E1C3
MSLTTRGQAPVFQRHGVTFISLAAPSRGARENSVWRFEVAPGTVGQPHRVTREETFVALHGRATIALDQTRVTLEAGDALAVPAGSRLSLSNAGPERFEGLAVLPVGGQVEIDGMAPFVPPWAA